MIHLRTLGALDLRASGGQPVSALLAQPKRIGLLAYLALATPRGFHRRDRLLALFWPEHDTEHARNSLSQSVHVLRRSLGPDCIMSRNGDAIGLDWAQFVCDAVTFDELLDAGRTEEAVALYGGHLLEGLHVDEAPDFERWLDVERARLSARHAGAIASLAELCTGSGAFAAAAAWWRRLATHDPYSSRAALGLMRALAAGGDPAAAVRHARAHEALLRKELDIAPDAEINAFVRSLQSPPAGAVWSSSLPAGAYSGRAGRETPAIDSPTVGVLPRIEPSSPDRMLAVRPRRLGRLAAVAGCVVAALSLGTIIAMPDEPSPAIRSLAVLPFENLSGDSTRDYVAEVLHDALIGELARHPDLSVRGRSSVLQYTASARSKPSEIARSLDVDGILETAIVTRGDSIEVAATLLHGPSARTRWRGVYRRSRQDAFTLKSELAAAIASELRLAISPLARPRDVTDSVDRELDVRRLYLEGRRLEVGRTPGGLREARRHYELALQRDPGFAPAYAGLSAVHYLLADYDYAPAGPALDTAKAMAERAFSLDSTNSAARTAMAVILATDQRFEAAERHFLAAIALNPSDAHAHFWYSVFLVAVGRGEEALTHANIAADLDPAGPRGITAMQRYALRLITGEHKHMEIPVHQRRFPVRLVVPDEPIAIAHDAFDLAQGGDCVRAQADIARAQTLVDADNHRMLNYVGSVYWLCNDTAGARRVAGRMKRLPDVRDHGYRVAMLHILFGEPDSALVWLRRNRWTLGQYSGLSADQRLDALRSDRRFDELLRQEGLRDP